MVLIQSQEGGCPGHQCGSSVGAAGPGYEPQPAHLPGPGRGTHPGEANVPSSKFQYCLLETPIFFVINQQMWCCLCCFMWTNLSISGINQLILSSAGGGWLPHCSGHHGWGGGGEQCHWEPEAALRGATPQWGGMALQQQGATSRWQHFPATGGVLQVCNNLKKKPEEEEGKPRHVPTPVNKHPIICFPFILCLSRLVGRWEQGAGERERPVSHRGMRWKQLNFFFSGELPLSF